VLSTITNRRNFASRFASLFTGAGLATLFAGALPASAKDQGVKKLG